MLWFITLIIKYLFNILYIKPILLFYYNYLIKPLNITNIYNICIFILDNSYWQNIFSLVVGLFIAILIFIAEFIKGEENYLEKKVILYETKIEYYFTLCILICFLIPFNKLSLIYNLLIIIFTFITLILFIKVIKMIIDNTYLENKIDKYINKKVIKNIDYINNNELRKINESYLNKTFSTYNGVEYDHDVINKLESYIEGLYKHNKSINIDYLIKESHIVVKDYNKFKEYINIINTVIGYTIKYNNLKDYKLLNEIMYQMFIKMIPSNYQKNIIEMYPYYIFNNYDTNIKEYYENKLYYLLSFIIYLIKNNKLSDVIVIINKISVKYNSLLLSNTLSDIDILNRQFIYTIIHSLLLYIDKYKINDSNKEEIKIIINLIKNRFGIEKDVWQAINNFKNNYQLRNMIYYLDNFLELSFYEKIAINDIYSSIDILREYLYIFNIYTTFTSINEIELESNDKLFFEELLRVFNNSSKFEIILNKEEDIDKIVKEYLIKIININSKS